MAGPSAVKLAGLLDVGPRQLTAFVGAGGKSTLLLGLGGELAAASYRVVLTTTTRFGNEELGGAVCRSPADVQAALATTSPVFLVSETDGGKAAGFAPEVIDHLYATTSVDYVLVEADGARRRPLKAPAAHEPVIPSTAGVVVVVAGLDALGQTVGDAAHRPERVALLTGCSEGDRITPAVVAGVVGHDEGGLKAVPESARVVVALTKATPQLAASGLEVSRLLEANPRIDRVVLVPHRAA